MALSFKILLTGVLFLVSQVVAEDVYFDMPTEKWDQKVQPVGDGNAVQISPDGKIVYVTSTDGTLTGLDAGSGDIKFTYRPPPIDDFTITCSSGVSIYPGNASVANDTAYAVYSVVDELGINPTSRVVAVSHPEGTLSWISTSLDGVAAGTPQITNDGKFVFLTHNSQAETVGHFTGLIYDTPHVLLSYIDITNPFAGPAVFHNPMEGYYRDGDDNTNDIFLWAHSHNQQDETVGEGATFAFQIPVGYNLGDPGLKDAVVYLDSRGWQTNSPPAIGNKGRTCFYSVSRNEFRGWIGDDNDTIGKFHKKANADLKQTPNAASPLERFSPPLNTPVLGKNESMVFAGRATNKFSAMQVPSQRNETAMTIIWEIETTSLVKSSAVVTKDDMYVFVTESEGVVYALDMNTGIELWTMPLTAPHSSEFSMNEQGDMLYIGDTAGNVVAW
eukprot:CAMPEP_0195295390 /NCGR_PEP_ID=MMETSP0707-20130614/17297_1 /TAXON_ID=33640 /ORGANISM="Asterionellopsis glacialis, Strain CCMP134" /LENGTH=443 /DNA_ID=CAMNT_0040356617 /DNA_START=65 /DNA_END=1393 /DNA_ORIENTATION=-